MTTTKFTLFPELVPELRTMIWQHAISERVQDIVDTPTACRSDAPPNRHRQAIVEDPLKCAIRKCSRILAMKYYTVHIRDPYDGRKIRLETDEFEELVNCLPFSAVCREARAHVAEFCQALAPHVHFKYHNGKFWSLGAPKDGDEPLLVRNVRWNPEAETLEHVFPRPTTLTVFGSGARGMFKSPEHLVDMINLFFGDRIRRLILELSVYGSDDEYATYWASHVRGSVHIEPVFDVDTHEDTSVVHLTRDRKLHVAERTWNEMRWTTERCAQHLLKFLEIFDSSHEKLPCLDQVYLNLEIRGYDRNRRWLLLESVDQDGVITSEIKSEEKRKWPWS